MPLLEKLDRLPPFAYRLLARRRDGSSWIGLSHREIGELSGLPKSTVADLSFRTTWAGVTVEVHDAFAKACGVDPFRVHRLMYALAGGKKTQSLVHARRGVLAQVQMYTKLLEMWTDFTVGPGADVH